MKDTCTNFNLKHQKRIDRAVNVNVGYLAKASKCSYLYNITDSLNMFLVSYISSVHPNLLVICCPQLVWSINLTRGLIRTYSSFNKHLPGNYCNFNGSHYLGSVISFARKKYLVLVHYSVCYIVAL